MPKTPSPTILLADADAFYVQVARHIDREGAGQERLLIVGGRADGRGVVTSASYEARAYGVHSAMPTSQALRLCPDAVVVPVPREACTQKSREILGVLERFTPVVEPASIDEFYLDLSGTEALYEGAAPEKIANRIRAAVLEETGLSVSIGGGPSKVVAKLAAKHAKPRPGRDGTGVYIVPANAVLDFMKEHSLADIPMVGPRFQERLRRLGLRTVEDALPHTEDTLVAWLGAREGRWLHRRVRGIDSADVSSPVRRSISHEETFAKDIEEDEELERELVRLAVQTTAGLRRTGCLARTLTVKVRDADFVTRQASRTFAEPVSTDRPVITEAKVLLKRLRRARRMGVRLLGVGLSQLVGVDATREQIDLFGDRPTDVETEHDRQLTRAVDDINTKYGRASVIRGTQLKKP